MSKLALLFICVFLFSLCSADFQRPWENRSWVASNPYIWSYGVDIWFGLDGLQKTPDSLDTIVVGKLVMNGSAASHAGRAAAYAGNASENKLYCMKEGLLNPLWSYSLPQAKLLELLFEFTRISNCIQYEKNWKGALGSSLDALEASGDEASKVIADARNGYEEMGFMGLCDRNYTGAGSERCAEMASAFYALDNNITEGRYGKYPLFLNYSSVIAQELRKPSPDMSLYGSMMGLVWGEEGIVPSFRRLHSQALEAKTDSSARFDSLKGSAEGRKRLAERELAELKAQDAHLIRSAPSSYSAHAPGTVSERFSGITAREDGMSIALAEASLERERYHKRGYLASSILAMAQVDEGYSELLGELEELEGYAEEVVGQQREEAEYELSQTKAFMDSSARSSESLALYTKAQSLFEKGGGASTLGKRFVAFYDAAAAAREARNQRAYSDELAIKSSLEELEALIDAGERDDINVFEEKESLSLLRKLDPYQIDDSIRSSINSIILKAKARYGELTDMRERIRDKITLGGTTTADLLTDLEMCEDGIIEGGQIRYPDAIGRLKRLKEDYISLEAELDQQMSEIVGGAMSTNAQPLIDGVMLDEPTNISLDIVMANPRDYGARNVPVKITMPISMVFLYSDIAYGREGVESLRMEKDGKTLILVLSEVKPLEIRRVRLEKRATPATTLKRKALSEGIGDGSARISEEIGFQLDMDIPYLTLPEGTEEARIDGLAPSRPLKEGRHTLTSQSILHDAYNESIQNIRAYRIGTNSKVEYDIRIISAVDLESVPVFIDSLNDTRISSFVVVAATGEALKERKRLSDTQYHVIVKGLKGGQATVLKVSYNVEDTESFVREQITLLSKADLSNETGALLEEARLQADAGNYSKALELVEKTVALSKEEDKSEAKLKQKIEDLDKLLEEELGDIKASLSKGNVSGKLIDRLYARKTELERLRGELEGSDLEQQVSMLEKADFKWLGKELTSFKKESYKEYNDLKERFYEAGNSSTPEEFMAFESSLNRLESGPRLEYAIEMLGALDSVKALVERQEKSYSEGKQSSKAELERVRNALEATLDRYSKEASSAKGTEYSSMFTESEKTLRSRLSEAQDMLEDDPRLLRSRLDYLEKARQRMQLTLDSLQNESEAKLSLLEALVRKSGLEGEAAKELSDKMAAMRGMISAGEYVNALRAGSAIAKGLEDAPAPGGNLLVLGLSALAVLAIIGLYIIRQQKGDGTKRLRKLLRDDEDDMAPLEGLVKPDWKKHKYGAADKQP